MLTASEPNGQPWTGCVRTERAWQLGSDLTCADRQDSGAGRAAAGIRHGRSRVQRAYCPAAPDGQSLNGDAS
jgi:hypothetical protein